MKLLRAFPYLPAALMATMLAAVFTAPPAARAQEYPARPVRLLVGLPPGGPTDIVARILGENMTKGLGQTFIIENRPGAAGVVAAGVAAKSPPDGYTLFFPTNATFAAHPFLIKDLPYDAERDFAPIALVASVPLILVVPPQSPVQSLQDVIALGKARAGQVNYATAGPGGAAHLATELFNMTAGTRFMHVPYKGGPPAMTAVMAGDVAIAFASSTDAIPLVHSGKLRAIGVTADRRLAAAPDIPTLEEAGLRMLADTWFGLVAPAGTPKPVIDKLERENMRVMKLPEVVARLQELGAFAKPDTTAEFVEFIKAERARWGDVIRKAGVKID